MMSLTVQLTRSRRWKQHCSDFECEECRQWWSKHEFRVGLENVAEKAQHSSLEITVYRRVHVCKICIGFYWHSNKRKTNERHVMPTSLHPNDGVCTKIKIASETFNFEFAQFFSAN